MKNVTRIAMLGLLAVSAAFAQQNSLVSTTLSAAAAQADTFVTVASATGINAPTATVPGSVLYVLDPGQTLGEPMPVVSVSSTRIGVRRTNGRAVPHVSGALVYVATAPNWFYSVDPVGSCTLANTYVSPWLNTVNGKRWECSSVTGSWVQNNDYFFYVPPTQCTTIPTTSTVTNTYPQIGASGVFVLNATTNAAAGTTTLSCNIMLPSRATTTRGAYLKDITVAVGSQTTAPTSIGTPTLGSISMPAPSAATQTASTVTPVTVGGTITQLGPTTTVATVTTAGAFLTFKYTFSTAVSLSTDLQLLQFTVPYNQSAAAAMTLNFPGLWVHYTAPAQ